MPWYMKHLIYKLSFWKCKHPAFWIAVKKDSTEEWVDEDFTRVTHHLYCQKCQADVDTKYMKLNGGHEAFMARGMPCTDK